MIKVMASKTYIKAFSQTVFVQNSIKAAIYTSVKNLNGEQWNEKWTMEDLREVAECLQQLSLRQLTQKLSRKEGSVRILFFILFKTQSLTCSKFKP